MLPVLLSFLLLSVSHASVSMSPEKSRPTRHFISTFSQASGISEDWLSQQFRNLQLNEQVISLIQKPYEDKIWGDYERLFITPKRINGGKSFLKEYAEFLDYAEKIYGVPKSVIVAILGVETNYGTNMGNFNALEALATLSFYYAPRNSFFEDEMKSLLILAHKKDWDLSKVSGSYAGALGMPQFMPSNVIRYAVSSDQKSQLDLFHHYKDAVLSVANYLKKHGNWKTNEPIVLPVQNISAGQTEQLNKQFENKNIIILDEKTLKLLPKLDDSSVKPGWLIRLKFKDKQHFYYAFSNFKSIMSYNNSTNYAFAVTYLSAALHDGTDRLTIK
ncbi:MAG: lytic murein transglycosylase B [Pseudomonadota bacterium]|nr:lytic murein transglycosylase B [Pseudomonadota bacterium]